MNKTTLELCEYCGIDGTEDDYVEIDDLLALPVQ